METDADCTYSRYQDLVLLSSLRKLVEATSPTVLPTNLVISNVFATTSTPFAAIVQGAEVFDCVLLEPADIISAAFSVSNSFTTSSPTDLAQTTGGRVDEYSLCSLSVAERSLWFSKYRERA